MGRRFLPLALLLLAAQAIAQPGGGGPGGGPGGRGAERGDRMPDRAVDRQQLRGDLKAASGARLQEAEAGVELASPSRHLSPRERAELRAQLKRESPPRSPGP